MVCCMSARCFDTGLTQQMFLRCSAILSLFLYSAASTAEMVNIEQDLFNLSFEDLLNVQVDIAQEAFIKAYRAIPNFRGESAFYTW